MGFTNEKQFKAAILSWADNVVPAHLVMWQKRIVFEALRKIIKRTPRDEGRLVGGWTITIDWVPAEGQTQETATKAQAISNNIGALANLTAFRVVFITNPVDYGWVLEEGLFEPPDPGPSKSKKKGRKGKVLVKGGFSTQAPQGMVGITFQELKTKYAGMVFP